MKKIVLTALIGLGIAAVPAFAQNQTTPVATQTLGQNFDGKPVLSPGRLPYVLKDLTKKDDLVLVGYVSDEGTDQGGWLKITTQPNSKDEVLVKVKHNAFILPANLKNKPVAVYGNLVKKAAAQNQLEKSLNNTSSATSQKEIYILTATGLKMEQ